MSPAKSSGSDRAYQRLRKRLQTATGRAPGGVQVRESIQNTERCIEELEFLRLFVPLVIADGPLLDRDEAAWRSVAELLPDAHGQYDAAEERRLRLIETIKRLLPKSEDRDQVTNALEDLHVFYLTPLGRTAYLLGLVVGQQLGPRAFKIGGRR